MAVTNPLATAYGNQKKGLTLSTGKHVAVIGETATEAAFKHSDDGQTWKRLDKTNDVVGTSTAANINAYSNQKKSYTLSTGRIVMVYKDATTNAKFKWTDDDGVFTDYAVDIAGWSHGSIHGYVDTGGVERLVVVWKQSGTSGGRTDGYIYLMVGAFNAGRTTLTWGTAITAGNMNVTAYDYPDVVVHAEGTGGTAHVAYSWANAVSNSRAYQFTHPISDAGVPAVAAASFITGPYANGPHHTFPSITIDSATKRTFMSWSAGAIGAGHGIRFVTASYSGGVWTWATEVEIDTTRFVSNAAYWVNTRWDGTRIIVGGQLYDGGSADVVFYESTNFTTFTTRIIFEDSAGSTRFHYGSLAVDAATGNVYLFGHDGSALLGMRYLKWVRSTLTAGLVIVLDPYVTGGVAYVNAVVSGTSFVLLYDRGLNVNYQRQAISGFVPAAHILGWASGSIAAYVDTGGTERLVATWKQSGTAGGRTDARSYFVVGSFNAGRTTLTWGTVVGIDTDIRYEYPDVSVVAYSTGARAAVAAGVRIDPQMYVVLQPFSIDSAGVPTIGTQLTVDNYATANLASAWPSIDLDGSGNAHVAWSGGQAGAGYGIRYMKLNFSGGLWAVGTEVEVDNARHSHWSGIQALRCRWDAARSLIVIAGQFYSATGSRLTIADSSSFTAFTLRVDEIKTDPESVITGTMVIDAATGDVYMFGSRHNGANYVDVSYYKATRAGSALTLGARVVVDAGLVPLGTYSGAYANSWFSDGTLRWIYIFGNNAPYQVKYDQKVLV